jgi:hypothetical protein
MSGNWKNLGKLWKMNTSYFLLLKLIFIFEAVEVKTGSSLKPNHKTKLRLFISLICTVFSFFGTHRDKKILPLKVWKNTAGLKSASVSKTINQNKPFWFKIDDNFFLSLQTKCALYEKLILELQSVLPIYIREARQLLLSQF